MLLVLSESRWGGRKEPPDMGGLHSRLFHKRTDQALELIGAAWKGEFVKNIEERTKFGGTLYGEGNIRPSRRGGGGTLSKRRVSSGTPGGVA